MKISLMFLLLISMFTASAQLLKLKKGQEFRYEGINSSLTKTQDWSDQNYMYWQSNFQVISSQDKTYLLKVLPKIIIATWNDGRIHDTTIPFEELPKEFFAVVRKVMTESSYQLQIDEHGNIIAIDGLEKIKMAVVSKAKELKIPEAGQSHVQLADMIITNKYIKTLSSFFEGRNSQKNKLGLIKSFTLDTTEKTRSATGIESGSKHIVNKMNLISEGMKTNKSPLNLLAEAKATLNYDDYYSAINKAKHKISELRDRFQLMKGSSTIKDEIMGELESLDKAFADDNFDYLAAKLELVALIDTQQGTFFMRRVPYEFIAKSYFIDMKLEDEFNQGNFINMSKAMKIRFTKFNNENAYAENLNSNTNTIHDTFARLIFKMNNKSDLVSAQNEIQRCDSLNIPLLTGILKGLKAYTQVKLTTDLSEISKIASMQFNSLYDYGGRYRILIYDELLKKQVPDSIRRAYIDYTIDYNLRKIDAIKDGNITDVSAATLEKLKGYIPLYRKNLADAYYRKSKLEKSTESSYLQMAADYLPTQQDMIEKGLTLQREYEFIPYIAYTDLFLETTGNTNLSEEAKLKRFVDLVIIEPERYNTLKQKYAKAFPNGDFKKFFVQTLKEKLPSVPNFSLTERQGAVVTNSDSQGKFVFIDFWGTWCGMCVAEIHKIEALHLKNPFPEKLNVTTIACFNIKKDVDDFMMKKKYTYPVLISDGKVEKNFKIAGYPTKLLLLPNGVYLTIPFSHDYNDILRKYLAWEI
ncbi:MAG: TlpA disulfide reductase family protein [Bacteroidota bacterium]